MPHAKLLSCTVHLRGERTSVEPLAVTLKRLVVLRTMALVD